MEIVYAIARSAASLEALARECYDNSIFSLATGACRECCYTDLALQVRIFLSLRLRFHSRLRIASCIELRSLQAVLARFRFQRLRWNGHRQLDLPMHIECR